MRADRLPLTPYERNRLRAIRGQSPLPAPAKPKPVGIVEALAAFQPDPLATRDRMAAERLAAGLTVEEVAARFGMDEGTVVALAAAAKGLRLVG